MSKNRIINIQGVDISVSNKNDDDYISLTDMVTNNGGADRIKNWIRNKSTIEFLGVWEQMYNSDFNSAAFDQIMMESGVDRFIISPTQWISKTNAIGITSKAGRFGGTYAHKDIAFELGSHLSPVFKLLLIKEFQRLKEDEAKRLNSEWDYRRFLAKTNYAIHTDAIKIHLVPLSNIPKDKEGIIYASEAELLNMAMFNITSKEWEEQNPSLALDGKNMRDYADAHELLVLSNLESVNAVMIRAQVPPELRVKRLRATAIDHLRALRSSKYTVDKIQSPFLLEHKQKEQNNFDQNLKGLLAVPPPKKKDNKEE